MSVCLYYILISCRILYQQNIEERKTHKRDVYNPPIYWTFHEKSENNLSRNSIMFTLLVAVVSKFSVPTKKKTVLCNRVLVFFVSLLSPSSKYSHNIMNHHRLKWWKDKYSTWNQITQRTRLSCRPMWTLEKWGLEHYIGRQFQFNFVKLRGEWRTSLWSSSHHHYCDFRRAIRTECISITSKTTSVGYPIWDNSRSTPNLHSW